MRGGVMTNVCEPELCPDCGNRPCECGLVGQLSSCPTSQPDHTASYPTSEQDKEIAALRSEVKRLRGERDEALKGGTVFLCAKCGHGSEEHGIANHPAYGCIADMRLVPAAFASRLAAAERERDEAQVLFKGACDEIRHMEVLDPHKRIAELEQTIAELNDFDVPTEMVELRARLTAIEKERDGLQKEVELLRVLLREVLHEATADFFDPEKRLWPIRAELSRAIRAVLSEPREEE